MSYQFKKALVVLLAVSSVLNCPAWTLLFCSPTNMLPLELRGKSAESMRTESLRGTAGQLLVFSAPWGEPTVSEDQAPTIKGAHVLDIDLKRAINCRARSVLFCCTAKSYYPVASNNRASSGILRI